MQSTQDKDLHAAQHRGIQTMINPARRSLLVAAATPEPLSTTTQADLAKVFRRRVLYEDNHVLAFDKPAGVLSQGDRTGDPCVADYAKAFLAEGRAARPTRTRRTGSTGPCPAACWWRPRAKLRRA